MSNENIIKSINEVIKLQDSFNSVVNPNWRTAGYPFYRAAWLEMAEFVDHVGTWKWWKKAERGDREQCVLELVDIFHFVLSDCILNNRTAEVIFGSYTKALSSVKKMATDEDIFNEVDAFIELSLFNVRTGSGVALKEFFAICIMFDVTIDELLKKYIGKNVLNKFRQDNGYKSGTYIKEWGPQQEDNHFLVIYRDQLGSSLTFDTLYDALRLKYAEVVQSSGKI